MIHYQLEILYDCAFTPLCENQRGEDAFADLPEVEMTTDESAVTCRECLAALGYEVAPDTGWARVAA